jgi:aspartate kinase
MRNFLERMKRIVAKFGGSSMRDASAMRKAAALTIARKAGFVIVSATYRTTDQLLQLASAAELEDHSAKNELLKKIREKHLHIADDLVVAEPVLDAIAEIFKELEALILSVSLLRKCSPNTLDQILSVGERLSSLLFVEALKEQNSQTVRWFDIREVMITNDRHLKAEPLFDEISQLAQKHCPIKPGTVIVSQGFIGRTQKGATTTLGRGGSDYSGSIIAGALWADQLEIWTDVPGISTCDPKVYPKARAIPELSYDEASEMAQYGAKILHPTTLVAAMKQHFPVFVGSTFEPEKGGTFIRSKVKDQPLVRAISHRLHQSLMVIKTPKMFHAFGFMSNIFRVFREHEVSVDCITTSEIGVAVSVDQKLELNIPLVGDLQKLGDVKFEIGYSLISLIGNRMFITAGMGKKLFAALGDINVRMMCFGASQYNLNILVKDEDCARAIQNLHQTFIEQ